MRLWTLHPIYMDTYGKNRNINEGIAGYNAFMQTGLGYPKAWEKHPQLIRFKESKGKDVYLQSYLKYLIDYQYADKLCKIGYIETVIPTIKGKMTVTKGQLKYEWEHYLKKLQKRSPLFYKVLRAKSTDEIIPHPLFTVIEGDIESWEKVK